MQIGNDLYQPVYYYNDYFVTDVPGYNHPKIIAAFKDPKNQASMV
jgi:hypothetical protein